MAIVAVVVDSLGHILNTHHHHLSGTIVHTNTKSTLKNTVHHIFFFEVSVMGHKAIT
jgi:hypothetical protein